MDRSNRRAGRARTPQWPVHRSLRGRFWIEVCLAGLALIMLVVTLISREWIEALTGWDPDQGDGSAEWLITIGLAVLAGVFSLLGRSEYRRARAA